MHPFHKWKISRKLIVLIVFVSGISVMLGFSALVALDFVDAKRELKQEHTMHARLIGTYCVAPLTFDDVNGAEEILKKSLAISSIESIYLYNEYGVLFAYTDRTDRKPERTLSAEVELNADDTDYLYSLEPILFRKAKYGSVYLRVNKSNVTRKMTNRLVTLSVALIILCVLSILLAGRLQKVISRPILNLASLARKVAANEDYTLRAHKSHDDEVGVLADDMNNLLEQIALREKERDHAEEELKVTRDYLRNLFDSLPSMVISIDEFFAVNQWNNTAEQWTGISSSDAVGQDLTSMNLFLNRYNRSIQESVQNQTTIHLQHVSAGVVEKKHYNISISPLSYGPNRGAVIRAEDVTEFVRQDTEIRQAQKMDTIGNLAGGLAHDFNNVLVGIVGTVSIMECIVDKPNTKPGALASLIKILGESAERARHLVKQLLTISHKQELSLSEIDLCISIRRIADVCRSTFDKRINIVIEKLPPTAIVSGDSSQLEQVLLNVCVNASHAMTTMRAEESSFGGTLSISLAAVKSTESFLQNHPDLKYENYFRVSIIDTGVGMSENIQAKIFDPFFTTKDSGTGLGLSMVYNIIHQHNGIIHLTSEEGQGTKLTFFLPAQDAVIGKRPSNLTPPMGTILKGVGKILVIDDEDVVRQVAQGMLESCGYNVVLAEDGIKGIELFKAMHAEIDAVLLDMMMPKMTGLQTYVELRKVVPDLKVIVASGFKLDERVQATLRLGANDFIQKPYTMARLSKKISTLLNS